VRRCNRIVLLSGTKLRIVHSLNLRVLEPSGNGKGKGQGKSRGKGKVSREDLR
jgi:hypothetical protein